MICFTEKAILKLTKEAKSRNVGQEELQEQVSKGFEKRRNNRVRDPNPRLKSILVMQSQQRKDLRFWPQVHIALD